MARMAEGVESFFLSGSSSMLLQNLVLSEFQKDKTEDMGPFNISSQIAQSHLRHTLVDQSKLQGQPRFKGWGVMGWDKKETPRFDEQSITLK